MAQQDPLLALVLAKLNSIETSIEKLADHVAVQNGRIGKLEKANAEELAVANHIDEELHEQAKRQDQSYRRIVATLSACSALVGGVLGVIVERFL
jgi:hypothetical protein